MAYRLPRETKELATITRTKTCSAEQLAQAAARYKRLLDRAMKTAPNDIGTLESVGAGLSALTRALVAVEKMRRDEPVTDEEMSPIFDVMGNVIGWTREPEARMELHER